MQSLLNYADSDISDDDEVDAASSQIEVSPAPRTVKNSVAIADENICSSSTSQKSGKGIGNNESKLRPQKLPNFLTGSKKKKNKLKHSVFVNPFEEAMKDKEKVLEKHVKLTDLEEREKEKKAARMKKFKDNKICLNFKKGRCNFGKSCRFSHDLSKQKDPAVHSASQPNNSSYSSTTSSHSHQPPHINHSHQQQQLSQPPLPPQHDNVPWNYVHLSAPPVEFGGKTLRTPSASLDPIIEPKRRKRHGVTDLLQPTKKAKAHLDSLRKKERPWTVQD